MPLDLSTTCPSASTCSKAACARPITRTTARNTRLVKPNLTRTLCIPSYVTAVSAIFRVLSRTPTVITKVGSSVPSCRRASSWSKRLNAPHTAGTRKRTGRHALNGRPRMGNGNTLPVHDLATEGIVVRAGAEVVPLRGQEVAPCPPRVAVARAGAALVGSAVAADDDGAPVRLGGPLVPDPRARRRHCSVGGSHVHTSVHTQ